MNNGTKNTLLRVSKKYCAGAKKASIDPHLREFDVVFLGKILFYIRWSCFS